MPRISVTIPDSDLVTIDNFLSSSSSGVCPSTRSEFFRWAALRFIREVEDGGKAIFI
jgi:metal-responsive CopG/Arc/MetJ family transcriptional regulator